MAADVLDAERERVAALMTTEMGKTLAAAAAEADKCARTFRFYAEHAEGFLADEPVDPAEVGAGRAYARYQPLGPVLAVMPWNFPLWQVVRFLAPALMAGNTGLLKHASNVPGTALFLEELVRRGVPRRRVPDAAHRVGPGRAGAARPACGPPPSPAASGPGGRWRPSPATRSSPPCSSSAAATRSW